MCEYLEGSVMADEYQDQIIIEETRQLRRMSIHESITQWLRLQLAFENQLQETEPLFGPERRQALISLQERLRKLKTK